MSRRLLDFLRRSKVLVLVAVLVLLTGVGTLIAQNPNSTAGLINQILTVVTATQSADQVNYRFTPPVAINSGAWACGVTNLTSSPRSVRVEKINGQGQLTDPATILELDPGFARIDATSSGLSGGGVFYCKFTVLNGTKNDIRADIMLQPGLAQTATAMISAE